MEPKYKHLLAPLAIRGYILKNRMVASTSTPHLLQGPETFPAESVIAHYANKAKGASVVTCMGINNFTRGKQIPMRMDFGHFPDYDLSDALSQKDLFQLADIIHFYNSLAAMCLFVGPPSASL
jgi:2,4-dienoyl-CoA reductase-like NADH-dependent reductase (Old Yellow Enzyme family)